MAKIKLPNVRLSFPSLFKTEVYNEEDTGKFTATFLLDKTTHAELIAKLEAAAKSALVEKYGEGKIPKGFKMPFVDGDDKDYDGYAGQVSIKAASKRRPVLYDRNKSPVVESDGVFYAGCYVNAVVDFWVMDNKYGKKVLCNLMGVQFSKHGDPFGSDGDDCMDDFDVIEDDGDDFQF